MAHLEARTVDTNPTSIAAHAATKSSRVNDTSSDIHVPFAAVAVGGQFFDRKSGLDFIKRTELEAQAFGSGDVFHGESDTFCSRELVVISAVRIMQQITGPTFLIVPTTAADWHGEVPTDLVGDLLITESPGTANGSVFCFWLGNKTLSDPAVIEAIQEYIDDHDVVGIRVVFGLPKDAHSSLRGDLERLKLAQTGAKQ